jgi:large subunit ribosomal protein L10
MPLKRDEKERIVADFTERVKEAEAVIITDYRGLDVAEISQLRRDLRESGSQFQVIKNTLMRRVLDNAQLDVPHEVLLGPTAVAILAEDLSGPAKALLKCAKDTESLVIKGGLMGGRFLDEKGVEALSKLPTREELLGQVLGVFTAPQRNTVTVLHAPMRDFVGVLRARVDAGDEAQAA